MLGFTTPRFVAPRVLQVPVRGSSVFVLLDRRLTLIDAGTVGSAPRILRALHAIGRGPDDIEQIVVTHYHPDHAGGVAALLRLSPARVAVHAVEAPYIRGERPRGERGPFGRLGALSSLPARLFLPPAPVDDVLRDGDELPALGGVRVLHTPGHTPGHVALYLPDIALLIAGDMLQVREGMIAAPSRLFSEDWPAALRSIGRLAGLEIDTIAFSHFPARYGPFGDTFACLAAGKEAPPSVAPAASGRPARDGTIGGREACDGEVTR